MATAAAQARSRHRRPGPIVREGGARADRDTPAAGTGHALAPGSTCTPLSASTRPCGARRWVTERNPVTSPKKNKN